MYRSKCTNCIPFSSSFPSSSCLCQDRKGPRWPEECAKYKKNNEKNQIKMIEIFLIKKTLLKELVQNAQEK